MRICYIADARSVHVQRFLLNLQAVEASHDLTVLSTRHFLAGMIGSARVINLTTYQGITTDVSTGPRRLLNLAYRHADYPWALGHLEAARMVWDLISLRRGVLAKVADIRPDIVHGMRLQLEGGLAGLVRDIPLALSIFGTDLTVFARTNHIIGGIVRNALRNAAYVIADNERDARLARSWGMAASCLCQVMPAPGGVDSEKFRPDDRGLAKKGLGIDPDTPLILCLRGFAGGSIHTDTVIRAAPALLSAHPDLMFILHGRTHSAGGERLRRLAKKIGVARAIRFQDIPSQDVPKYLQAADVMVSPTTADGTPMSMLEAMSCGCVPVMSDIDSIREWVTDGKNGFLFEPRTSASLVEAIEKALACDTDQVAKHNSELLRGRANPTANMAAVLQNYRTLLGS